MASNENESDSYDKNGESDKKEKEIEERRNSFKGKEIEKEDQVCNTEVNGTIGTEVSNNEGEEIKLKEKVSNDKEKVVEDEEKLPNENKKVFVMEEKVSDKTGKEKEEDENLAGKTEIETKENEQDTDIKEKQAQEKEDVPYKSKNISSTDKDESNEKVVKSGKDPEFEVLENDGRLSEDNSISESEKNSKSPGNGVTVERNKDTPKECSISTYKKDENISCDETSTVSAVEKAKKMEEEYSALGVKRCTGCFFTTDDESLFKAHEAICTKKTLPKDGQILLYFADGVYTCRTCHLKWENKAEFDEHVVCHISDDPYICMSCRKHFSSRELIEQHVKQEHPNGDSRCGLRGIKKGRQFVEELEKNGSLTLFGKIRISKTPRNQTGRHTRNQTNTSNNEVADTSVRTPSIPTTLLIYGQQQSSAKPVADKTGNVTHTLMADKVNPPINIENSCPLVRPVLPGPSQSVRLPPILPKDRPLPLPMVSDNVNLVRTQVTSLSENNATGSTNQLTAATSIGSQSPVTDARSLATRCRPILQKLQSKLIPSNVVSLLSGNGEKILTTGLDTGTLLPKNNNQQEVTMNSLFGIVNKESGVLEPATIPSKIQKLVPSQPIQKKQEENSTKNPQYHVKHITEYTNANSITTLSSTTAVNSQSLYFIPVSPVFHPLQTNQNVVIQPVNVTNSVQLSQVGDKDVQTIPSISNTSNGQSKSQSGASVVHEEKKIGINQNPQFPFILPKPQSQILLVNNGVTVSNEGTAANEIVLTGSKHNAETVQVGSSATNCSQSIVPDTPVSSSESLPIRSESFNPQGSCTVTNNTTALIQQLPKQYPPPYEEAVEALKDKSPSHPNSVASSKVATTQYSTDSNNHGSRYLFRIKPGNGFVCEACKKYTKDEFIYRNHIWNHFHIDQKACQSCSAENIFRHQVSQCKLVNSIVCNLIKKSALERQRMQTTRLNTDEVISISDDEEDHSKPNMSQTESETEVIVVDEEGINKSSGLQIQIASTCTISEDDYDSGHCGSKEPLKEIPEKGQTSPFDKTRAMEELAQETDKTGSEIYETKTANTDSFISKTGDKHDHEDSSKNYDVKAFAAVGCKQEIGHDSSSHHYEESKVEDEKNSLQGSQKAKGLPVDVQKHVLCKGQSEKPLTVTESPKSVQNKCETVIYSRKDTVDSDETTEIALLAQDSSNAFYMCGYEFCSFTAFTPNKYKIHLRQNHLNEFNFVCCHCGLKDYTEESHIRHLNTHASAKSFALYTCPARLCSYKSNLLQYYVFHLNAHMPEDVNLKCVYCHKIFETTEKLQLHLQNNLLKFVSCNYCSFKFGNKYHVIQHMRKAHPDKPRQVSVSSQIVCLEREINFYNPPPAKSCLNSQPQDGSISQPLNIPAIIEQVQMESTSNGKKRNNSGTESTDQNCTKSDVNKTKPKIKSNDKQSENRKHSKSAGPKSLLCPKCSYLSYNVALYTRHVSLHDDEPDREKRFVCNFCPTAVDSYVAFKNHVSNHVGRNEIKLFNCTMCGFSTNLKCHIMDHCQDNHDGTGMFTVSSEVVISNETSCKYCNFKSRQAEQVILHEKLVHQLQPSVSLGQKIDLKEATSCPSRDSLSPKVSSKETPKKHKYHCDYCEMVFKHKLQLITHLKEQHDDVDDKKFTFYKCKYCTLGSTRKEMIVTHLEREHPGKDIRILRKIEKVPNKHSTEEGKPESKNDVTIEVVIPDGNVFKAQFKCPKCPFSTLMRLNAIRHLKDHPELKPVRQTSTPKSKKTARKSTTGLSQKPSPIKPINSLVQNRELKENPFTAVKEAVDKLKSTEKTATATYNLGDDDLHAKLSACFIPIERDMKFKCRICEQEVIKKFVLHRHVLNHLNVSFFKCQYCTEGSVEKTLLFGHIQKSHPQQPLLYHQLEKCDIDNLIQERVFEQSFNSRVESKQNNIDDTCVDQTRDDKASSARGESLSAAKSHNGNDKKHSEDDGYRKYQCSFEGCRYRSRRADLMEKHLMHHGDTKKDYRCSLCDFRNEYFYVFRHVSREHDRTATAVRIDFEEEFKLNGIVGKKVASGFRESSVESLTSVLSDKEGQYVKNVHGKRIKIESLTVSKNVIYEMKKVFKCKDCGEKRTSRSGLYKHFKSTKCRRPALQCSLCSFQRYTKIDILRHARIRHPGKKVQVNSLPLTSKMAYLKIPIKQNFADKKSEAVSGDMHDATKKQSSAIKNEKGHSDDASICAEDQNLSRNQDVVCGLCSDFKCESVMKLQYHINTAHDGKLLHCQECVYKTPLIKHMLNHCTNVHLQRSPRYSTNVKEEKDLDRESESKDIVSIKTKYPCVKCSYEHHKLFKLRPHYYQHLKYKPYVCAYCGAGLQVLNNVKRHILNIHKDKPVKYKYVKKVLIESRVEKLMTTSRNLMLRRKETDEKRRKETDEKRPSPVKSKKRPIEHDSDSECQKAKRSKGFDGKKTDPNRTMMDEQEMKSGNSPPFKFQVSIDKSGNRVFKCSQCDYTCSTKKRLKQHTVTHGARFFKCFYCSYSSKMKSNAYRHCRRAHKDKETKIIDRKQTAVLTPKGESRDLQGQGQSDLPSEKARTLRYACFVCHKVMERLSDFEKHLSMHSYFQANPVCFSVRVTLSNSDIEACEYETFLEDVDTHSTTSKDQPPVLEKQPITEGKDEHAEISECIPECEEIANLLNFSDENTRSPTNSPRNKTLKGVDKSLDEGEAGSSKDDNSDNSESEEDTNDQLYTDDK